MKPLKIVALIFVNGIAYFALCVGLFVIYAFLSDGTVGQEPGMIGSPLLVVIFVSVVAAIPHGLIYGLTIGLAGSRLPKNPIIGGIGLGLSWLLILMIASWFTSSSDDGGGFASWIYVVLFVLSVPTNLATILIGKKTSGEI